MKKRLWLSEKARNMSEKLEGNQKLESELMTRIQKLEKKKHDLAYAQQRNKEMEQMLDRQTREDELLELTTAAEKRRNYLEG